MRQQTGKHKKAARRESGYALLALLAGMTIALIIMAAAAAKPSVRFESQRENEEEMMFRAVQVANAIQAYAQLKGGLAPQNLPTKLEEIAKEFNINGRELHLVRASAMVDPLMNDEWKPVRLGDPMVRDFLRAYMQEMAKQQAQAMASGGAAAAAMAQQQQGIPPLLMLAAQTGGIDLNKLTNASDEEEEEKATTASGFSLGGDSDSRPIIGVISKSKKQLIRNYYGIENYEKALFISGIQPNTLNYQMPIIGGPPPGTNNDPNSGVGTTPTLKCVQTPGGRPCPPGTQ